MENAETKHEISETKVNEIIDSIYLLAARKAFDTALPKQYHSFLIHAPQSIKEFEKYADDYLKECEALLRGTPELESMVLPVIQQHPKGIIEYFISRLPNTHDGLKSVLKKRLKRIRTTAPQQVQAAEIVTDGNGNVIGVVVHGKFQWLCSKADVGKILARLCQIKPQSTKAEIIQQALKYVPEIAQAQNIDNSLRSAMNDANKPERTATKIDVEAASQAVLPYF